MLDPDSHTIVSSTVLERPTGSIVARLLSSPGPDNQVRVRTWLPVQGTARLVPFETFATVCPIHGITYMESDYPHGCPRCQPGRVR